MTSTAVPNSKSSQRLDDVDTGLGDLDIRVTALEEAPTPAIPSIFAGVVNAAGAGIFLPSGWSSSRGSAGVYTVTFDSAIPDTLYSVVVTPSQTGNFQSPAISSKTVNSFVVDIRAVGTSFVDSDFNFIMSRG